MFALKKSSIPNQKGDQTCQKVFLVPKRIVVEGFFDRSVDSGSNLVTVDHHQDDSKEKGQMLQFNQNAPSKAKFRSF